MTLKRHYHRSQQGKYEDATMIKVSSQFKRSVMPLIVTMVTHSEVFPLHTGQLCHYVLLDASRPGAKLEKVWRCY